MSETSMRDVFLSMQFPPVHEIVATSKTDFRTIRKSRRSCYRSYHVGNNAETNDTSTVLIDELIDRIQIKNKHLEEHLKDENRAIEDLTCKRRELDLWRQLTNLVILPSTRTRSAQDHLTAYDLNEKKTVEFRKDADESASSKAWNYIGRHVTDELIETILHESVNPSTNGSNGHHAVKKARRTNDIAQKIRPSNGKATTTTTTSNLQSKAKRTTRRSRM